MTSPSTTGNGHGPVAPLRPATLEPLDLSAVRLDPAQHLGAWQDLNRTATIPHCLANLETSGALDNLRRLVGRSEGAFRGFWFADSDIHKTLEAVGWDIGRTGENPWSAQLDEILGLLAEVQQEDGYLDSWIQGSDDPRWDNLRWSHEMYCAGHLFQAAVALNRAGDGRLLAIARRLADLLVTTFGEGGRDLYDGHAEVETALVELYRETGHEPYLALASRQVELRGSGTLGEDRFGPQYFQDHAKVRDATEAIGHSVRQLYLAAGVTDVYLENGDASLLEAMQALWQDTFSTKTYITGAHGSRHRDEAYGDAYELPPDRAYAETCAAIAAFQWNWRMLLATGEGRFAEEMERALYNNIAASTSCSGTEFFYSNPLQLRTGHDGSTEDAPSERLGWYACACCPPNLARLVASVQAYVATRDGRGVQLHLLSAGTVTTTAPDGGAVTLTTTGDYPWDGALRISVTSDAAPWELAVRIPEWCEQPRVTVNSGEIESPAADGYLRIQVTGSTQIELDLPMPARTVSAHPRVDAVRGCLALARGPLVYCLEQVDQEPGVLLEDIRIDADFSAQTAPSTAPGVLTQLAGTGRVIRPPAELYLTSQQGSADDITTTTTVTAIPYFRWANRGANAMRVWIPTS